MAQSKLSVPIQFKKKKNITQISEPKTKSTYLAQQSSIFDIPTYVRLSVRPMKFYLHLRRNMQIRAS